MIITMDKIKKSTWHKLTSCFLSIFFIFQLTVPSIALAVTHINDSDLEKELTSEQMFARSIISGYLYEKSKYISASPSSLSEQTIEEFHAKLERNYKSRLPSEIAIDWIPISNGITFFIPKERTIYPLGKVVGDKFVQRKLIGNQIKRLIGRTYYSGSFNSEHAQIQRLYQNAYELVSNNSFTHHFGEVLPTNIADTVNKDFIWPELRKIGNEHVLVPTVHFRQNTVDNKGIDGKHVVEFTKSNASFKSALISNTDLQLQRDTVFSTIGDLVIGDKASISIDDSAVKIYAGVSFIDDGSGGVKGISTGTLYNYGQINSQRNVDIVAGNYVQKTYVHRFKTAHGFKDRLGIISKVNAQDSIMISSYGDIQLVGAALNANTGRIILDADGDIHIGSQTLRENSKFKVDEYDVQEQKVSYFQSVLSANDLIQLISGGDIEISGAQLLADNGIIDLLAANNISIVNDVEQDAYYAQDDTGRKTDTIRELSSIAVTAALDAGKGVIIRSELGDIKMQGVDITSTEGAKVTAEQGKVKFLLARDTYKYYRQTKSESLWRIKTRTEDEQRERPVYNDVVGGIEINASTGVELHLANINGESKTYAQLKAAFAANPSLSWMSDLADNSNMACPARIPEKYGYLADGSYNFYKEINMQHYDCVNDSTVNIIFEELKNYRDVDTSRSLTPAAMAVIAIAVSVAVGPNGFNLINSAGGTSLGGAIKGIVGKKAFAAGIVSLSTQAASSLAAGNSFSDTLKTMTSSDGIRATATAMVTAGIMEHFDIDKFVSNFPGAETLDQVYVAIIDSTVRAGVTWGINGGSLSDLDQMIVSNLKSYAIRKLGQEFVEKIDATWNIFSDEGTDVAMNYIANAFAGCLIGVATHEANSTPDDNAKNSCAAGAAGSVAGRYIGKTAVEANVTLDDFNDARIEYRDKISAHLANNPGMSVFSAALAVDPFFKNYAQNMLSTQKTADLTRLSMGLTTFLLGGSAAQINLVDQTASNQVNAVIDVKLAELLKLEADLILADRAVSGDDNKVIDLKPTDPLIAEHLASVLALQDSKEGRGLITAEEYEQLIEEKLSQNYSQAEIEEIKQKVDIKFYTRQLEKATRNLSKLGGSFGCEPGDMTSRCVKELSVNAKQAFGLYDKFKDASRLDYHAKGTKNLGAATETQKLAAQVVEGLQPIGQPLDELTQEVVDKYRDELDSPAVKGVLFVIDFLKAPIWTASELLISKTPLGKELEQTVMEAHTASVTYVAEGSSNLSPGDVSSTISGLFTAGEIVTNLRDLPKTVDDLRVSKARFENTGLTIANSKNVSRSIPCPSSSSLSAFGQSSEFDSFVIESSRTFTTSASGCTITLTEVKTRSNEKYLTFSKNDKDKKDAIFEIYQEYFPNGTRTKEEVYDLAINQGKALNLDSPNGAFATLANLKDTITNRPMQTDLVDNLYGTDHSTTDKNGASYSYADLTADKTRIEQAKAQLIRENPNTYKDMPEYKALVNETREVSELGGTIAGKAAAERLGDVGSPNESLLAQWPDGSKNVNFDDVRRMTIDGQEVLVIIENKGGEAVLGKRLTGEGEYAQQGTPEYHYSLMKSMEAKIKRLDEDARNIPGSTFAAQLEEVNQMFLSLENQPVRFYHVQQKFDIHGNPAGIIVDRFPDIPRNTSNPSG